MRSDGSLCEHIRFPLQLPILIQHFQRTEKIVAGIIRERQTVPPLIDKAVFSGKGIVKLI